MASRVLWCPSSSIPPANAKLGGARVINFETRRGVRSLGLGNGVFRQPRLACRSGVVAHWGGIEGDNGREEEMERQAEVLRRRRVAVFWDLDNKPPNSVPPYDAALRLKKLAGEIGEVVDMVAYANKSAFTYIPVRVREERQDRKLMDQLEKRGLVKVEQPYVCSMCGRRCKTNLALKKHFKQLHERERQKRMTFLGSLKGKKRMKFLEKVADKESKYKEAARGIIVPKVGYGLASELKRAGVVVRTVESRPQAADEALIQHMRFYMNRGIDCICLVSDDSDFRGILRTARSKRLYTVVIGDTHTLRSAADTCFSWEDVTSGRALRTANDSFIRWSHEDALRQELVDGDEDLDDEVYFSESEENVLRAHLFHDDDDEFSDVEEDDDDRAYFSESDNEEEFINNLRRSLED